MARKTAKQRRQEQHAIVDQFNQSTVEQFNETFELRMLRVLNQVCSLSDKFDVDLQSHALVKKPALAELQESMNFCVSWYGDRNHRERVVLPAFRFQANDHTEVWPWEQALDQLEVEVEKELERRAEAKRKAELRNSALSKLSKEERAALNL